METEIQAGGELESGTEFLAQLKKETGRLNKLVHSAEEELEADDSVPEEARGKLRVAVGKSKMLLRKKFVQFEKLCLQNLGKDSDARYPVTVEDLAGFWDTIVIQIIQVYKIFEEVDVWRQNNWLEPPPTGAEDGRKRPAAKKTKGAAIVAEAV